METGLQWRRDLNKTNILVLMVYTKDQYRKILISLLGSSHLCYNPKQDLWDLTGVHVSPIVRLFTGLKGELDLVLGGNGPLP